MSLIKHLVTLEPDELLGVYRYWAGDIGVPTGNENLVKQELVRLMTDDDRVLQRFRDLPDRCREFLEWMLEQEDYAAPMSRFDEDASALPVRPFEAEPVAFALRKRGFITEARDLDWMSYDEPVWLVPGALGDVLVSALRGGDRTLKSQLSLRAFLRTLRREEVSERLAALGLDPELAEDRAQVCRELAKPETLERMVAGLEDPELRATVERVLYDHGGVGEARHLERLACKVEDPSGCRHALENAFLGTVLNGDLTDVGLQLGPGSVIVFLEFSQSLLLRSVEVNPDEEPEPPADVLADLQGIRTFIDHHSVRVTRDGALYRATRRKMETELLSPGSRPVDREMALSWALRFLSDADLVRPDDAGRMRTTGGWEDLEGRGPVERTELLLTYVQNDLKDTKGAFHQPRLRKLFLNVLAEAGSEQWLSIRSLANLARNRYLLSLDRDVVGERFQKRYKYAPIPPLAPPAVLTRELVRFATEGLALAGLVQVLEVEDDPVAIRITRLGAAAFGLPVAEEQEVVEGALIVTADFEIVLFPEAGGIDLIHEVSRFARREKADYSIHYRISERTVQEAVAGGLSSDGILEVLERHGRHEVPQNVERSIGAWAESVRVLSARRALLIEAPTREALDAALEIKELKAIAGTRLNETVLELSEDPSTPRVAEALRTQGFFLR